MARPATGRAGSTGKRIACTPLADHHGRPGSAPDLRAGTTASARRPRVRAPRTLVKVLN